MQLQHHALIRLGDFNQIERMIFPADTLREMSETEAQSLWDAHDR